MAEPTLQCLGEQIARIQTELRDLRSVRSDVAHLRAEMADIEQRLNSRIDGLEGRFDQAQETAATNLAIVLEAIKSTK